MDETCVDLDAAAAASAMTTNMMKCERVKVLEDSKQRIESVVLVDRSQVRSRAAPSDGKIMESDEHLLPEIETRVHNKNILLKMQCEKRKGLLVTVIEELEKLNFSIVNASVATFGNFVLDITIIAEMEKEFDLPDPVNDIVVAALRCALQVVP